MELSNVSWLFKNLSGILLVNLLYWIDIPSFSNLLVYGLFFLSYPENMRSRDVISLIGHSRWRTINILITYWSLHGSCLNKFCETWINQIWSSPRFPAIKTQDGRSSAPDSWFGRGRGVSHHPLPQCSLLLLLPRLNLSLLLYLHRCRHQCHANHIVHAFQSQQTVGNDADFLQRHFPEHTVLTLRTLRETLFTPS